MDRNRDGNSFRERIEWQMRHWYLFAMLPVLLFIITVCGILLFYKCYWQKYRNQRLREQGFLPTSQLQIPPYANSAVYSPLSVRPPPTTVVALPSQHSQPTPDSNSVNPPTPGWNLSETGMVSAQLPLCHSRGSISAISSSPRLLHQPPTAPVLLPSAPAIENNGAPAGFSSNPSAASDKPPVYADVMKGNSVPESENYPKAKVTIPDTPPPEYTGTVFYSNSHAK